LKPQVRIRPSQIDQAKPKAETSNISHVSENH
jgi:hypothetical protein